MRCEQVMTRLDAYITGELPARNQRRIASHLEACERCRAAAADLRRMMDLFAQAAAPAPPMGFAARVAAEARRREAGTARVAAPSWTPAAWWKALSLPMRAAAAAALVVGLSAGVWVSRTVWRRLPGERQPVVVRGADPLREYNVDYLTEAPQGSLADDFLVLLSDPARKGT